MKALIIKEKNILFLVNILNVFITFLGSALYVIFRGEGNFDIGLIVLIFLSTFYSIESSFAQGNASMDDMLLRSLPMDRDLIVGAKYISVLFMILNSLVIIVTSIILFGSSLYSGVSIFEVINIWKIIISCSIVLFTISLFLITYYSKKGINKKKSTSLDTMLYSLLFLLFLLAMWKGREATYLKNILLKFDNPLFVIIIFAISLLFYFISYLVSVRIYRNTEF